MYTNYISDNDCALLFFILVFLKLFYKPGYIDYSNNAYGCIKCSNDDTLLFFILVFLKLFYK